MDNDTVWWDNVHFM